MLIVSNRKEESISIQRVKQCVNFSGSNQGHLLFFLAASLAMQKNMANMFGLISWYTQQHLPVRMLPAHLNLTISFIEVIRG